jgi:hypothetical protein
MFGIQTRHVIPRRSVRRRRHTRLLVGIDHDNARSRTNQPNRDEDGSKRNTKIHNAESATGGTAGLLIRMITMNPPVGNDEWPLHSFLGHLSFPAAIESVSRPARSVRPLSPQPSAKEKLAINNQQSTIN